MQTTNEDKKIMGLEFTFKAVIVSFVSLVLVGVANILGLVGEGFGIFLAISMPVISFGLAFKCYKSL